MLWLRKSNVIITYLLPCLGRRGSTPRSGGTVGLRRVIRASSSSSSSRATMHWIRAETLESRDQNCLETNISPQCEDSVSLNVTGSEQVSTAGAGAEGRMERAWSDTQSDGEELLLRNQPRRRGLVCSQLTVYWFAVIVFIAEDVSVLNVDKCWHPVGIIPTN